MTVICWLGQACFIITTVMGSHILIDPPSPMVGYHVAAHSIDANTVFVSHEHPDHNYVEAAKDNPVIVQPLNADDPAAAKPVKGNGDFSYERIFAYHDNVQGKQRGPDTITEFTTGGLRFVHLGDLGQLRLTPEQLKAIGKVDVLMIPVGGFYTIDAKQAVTIVNELKPRVIIPMHYGTPALSPQIRSKLAPADGFLKAMQGQAQVVRVKARDLSLSQKTLPKKQTIYVLRYD